MGFDGLPSDVGGEGDGVRGVPNRKWGVVFVEDDTKRDGDDNDSSARKRDEACWEDGSVVSGLPKGSSGYASLGSGMAVDISCGSCVHSSTSYWSSISRSFCFQSERPEETDWRALEVLLLSSESGMTSSTGAMLEYDRGGGEGACLRLL